MIKAVIYDLDDLMVNSAPAHIAAFDAVLEKYGHKYLDLPEKLRAKFVGMRIIDILGEIVKCYGISEEPASIHEKRQKVFPQLVRKLAELMPGLKQSLVLVRRMKLKIALASSGTKAYIGTVLQRFGIGGYFDVVISGEDVLRGKPDPEI